MNYFIRKNLSRSHIATFVTGKKSYLFFLHFFVSSESQRSVLKVTDRLGTNQNALFWQMARSQTPALRINSTKEF